MHRISHNFEVIYVGLRTNSILSNLTTKIREILAFIRVWIWTTTVLYWKCVVHHHLNNYWTIIYRHTCISDHKWIRRSTRKLDSVTLPNQFSYVITPKQSFSSWRTRDNGLLNPQHTHNNSDIISVITEYVKLITYNSTTELMSHLHLRF